MSKPIRQSHSDEFDRFDSFGELLRHLRRRTGLTQRDLGQAVGYSETHVTRLENGQRLPDLTAVKGAFVDALGINRDPAAVDRLISLAVTARRQPAMRVSPDLKRTKHTNLPAQLTSFVGRKHEVAEVQALIGTSRLLTLTGPGGVGKTRLAQAAGAGLVSTFADGIWLVELAALAQPSLVAPAIAAALRLRGQTNRVPREYILDYLEDKHVLLILDNCEHLLAECAELTLWLLHRCPQLHVLTTSRETLRLPGEKVYRVPALALPPLSSNGSMPNYADYSAIALFVSRGALARDGFELTHGNSEAIARVCRRLDGIPLAIELVASQLKALSVEQLSVRLEQGFHLRFSNSQVALPQHQTLHATMDWSHALLSEAERVLFRRLSAFPGSFSLEWAEAVGVDPLTESPSASDQRQSVGIFNLLTRLIDKSFVVPIQADDDMRYRMLDTVRHYGQDKLTQAGEADVVRMAYLTFATAFAEQAEMRLYGPEQAQALKDLDAEYDNLRTALEWALGHGYPELGLRLAAALWPYWLGRGNADEGRSWLVRMLSANSGGEPVFQMRALIGLVSLSLNGQDLEGISQIAEQALSLAKTLNNEWGIAFSLNAVAVSAGLAGNLDQARIQYEESLIRLQHIAHRWGVMHTTLCYGFSLLMANDLDRAVARFESGLTLSSELNDCILRPWIVNGLAFAAMRQGDIPQAKTLFDQARQLWQNLGDSGAITVQLNIVGSGFERLGDYAYARSVYSEVLRLRRNLGSKRHIITSLEAFAGLATAEGDYDQAARLMGSVASLREANGISVHDASRAESIISKARSKLDKPTFDSAWAQGQVMTLEQAIECALRGEDQSNEYDLLS
jgi:predicted ATPase/DNA-binding XRE family transcriptional regulator